MNAIKNTSANNGKTVVENSSKPVGTMTCVGALPSGLQFVSDSQDVQAIKEHFGQAVMGEFGEYDAFFVRVGDGEYTEVWGICGIVPRLSKLTTRLV